MKAQILAACLVITSGAASAAPSAHYVSGKLTRAYVSDKEGHVVHAVLNSPGVFNVMPGVFGPEKYGSAALNVPGVFTPRA